MPDDSKILFTETADYRSSIGTVRLTVDWFNSVNNQLHTKSDSRLVVILNDLEDYYKQFREACAQLLGGLDPVIDNEEYIYVQSQLELIQDKVIDFRIKRQELQAPNASSTPTFTHSRESTSYQKLPDLPIPKFDGRTETWISFLDQFDSVVDTRTDLTPTHKLHYLVSALSDEPRSLIQHLRIEAGNYEIARDLLKRRYHNLRVLADTYIENILSLPSINSRLSGLRASFLNPLLTSYRCLERLTLPVKHWSYILMHICLGKLPSELRSRFERNHGDNPIELPTFDQLVSFLEDECRHHDNVGNTSLVDSVPHKFHSRAIEPHHAYDRETPRKSKCFMCSSTSHYLRECSDFRNMLPRDRYNFVKASGLAIVV